MRVVNVVMLELLVIGGCTVGSAGDPDTHGNQPDAATDHSMVDASVATPDAPVGGFACRNQQPLTAVGDGHHHPGENCLNACHNHGFTLAGTMTTTAASTTPFVGGSLTVKDANGATFDMVTQANGNFYTTTAVVFPVTVTASACPSIHAMSGTVATGSGGCNKTGCHSATGGAGHIALP